ncbi:MAG: dihydrodipicolinate synthase family protein [Deltaproteobacteria bacterium]|nr:dihydrodipicolinate synthase family protein [Deltaproteobacteria bacterium]MBW2123958.1 dihydrodipicolinate synthase family protein [Deltaproteobacteria bacterium]
MPEWKGVIAAIVTPMKDGGNAVDPEPLGPYCDFLIEKGVDGLFALGTTGEGPVLSVPERKAMAGDLVARVNGRVKVIIQTGCITARETIELTRHCRDAGADAAGVVLPYYYRLDEEEIFRHFARIADGVPGFPLFVYDIPDCTGNDLTPALFRRLIDEIETIVGLKTSSSDLFRVRDCVRAAGDRCPVFVGCDSLILPVLLSGARGIVSGTASAFPEPFVRIYRAFEKGDLGKSREHQAFIDRLVEATGDGDIALFKKALAFRGVEAGTVREPHRSLSPGEEAALRASLEELGLIP